MYGSGSVTVGVEDSHEGLILRRLRSQDLSGLLWSLVGSTYSVSDKVTHTYNTLIYIFLAILYRFIVINCIKLCYISGEQ